MTINWIERVESIKTNNKKIKGKMSYAVNKPLLLLYLIGKLINSGKSDSKYSEVEHDLGEILQNFGNKKNTLDPFFRLRADGLFVVKEIDMSKFSSPQDKGYSQFLKSRNPVGYLERDFEKYLKLGNNLQIIVGLLLSKYFQYSIHNDVLSDVKLHVNPILPEKNMLDAKRDRLFAKTILEKYDSKCLFCGYFGSISGRNVGMEAAHIVMHSRGGSNTADNGLSLCSLCHRLFDRGVISLDPDCKIIISKFYSGKLTYITNKPILKGNSTIKENIRWHRQEIFNG
jgi:putative restriction endonuclease